MKDLRKQSQTRPGLAENIRNGLAVPILSDEVVFDLAVEGHRPLAQAYAEYSEYKLDDRDILPRIARFYKLRRQKEALLVGGDFTNSDLRADFLHFVKGFLCDHAEGRGGAGAERPLHRPLLGARRGVAARHILGEVQVVREVE